MLPQGSRVPQVLSSKFQRDRSPDRPIALNAVKKSQSLIKLGRFLALNLLSS
ncbi:MAG: hypothetical protein ACOYME_13180 [Prochlorotrichaceae cyanobacterium]